MDHEETAPVVTDSDGLAALLKEQHYYELERKDKILSNLSLPIGFLSLSSGGFIYFSQHFPLRGGAWGYLFCMSLLVTLVLFGVAAGYAAATFHGKNGYEYAYLPSADVQLRYYRQCLEAYRRYPNAEALSMSALKNNLIEIYGKAASRNHATNNRRADYLYHANGATLTMLFFFGLTIASFAACKYESFAESLTDAPPGNSCAVRGILKEAVSNPPGGKSDVRQKEQRKTRAATPRGAAAAAAPGGP